MLNAVEWGHIIYSSSPGRIVYSWKKFPPPLGIGPGYPRSAGKHFTSRAIGVQKLQKEWEQCRPRSDSPWARGYKTFFLCSTQLRKKLNVFHAQISLECYFSCPYRSKCQQLLTIQHLWAEKKSCSAELSMKTSSITSGLIWICTVCSDLSFPIFWIFTILPNFNSCQVECMLL